MDDTTTPTCPLCPFSDADANFVAQHIEFCHPETGEAPDLVEPPPATTNIETQLFSGNEDLTDRYVDCPHGCGESVPSTELSTHLDLHVAEDLALEDSGATTQTRSDVDLFPEDDDPVLNDDDDSLDLPESSRKGGKRGPERDFSRANTAKPARPRSPPRTTNADGVKRLGVSYLINSWISCSVSVLIPWIARRVGSARP